MNDKEKVWNIILETESDRRLRRVREMILQISSAIEEANGHKKDE